jgi:hypothetical protein
MSKDKVMQVWCVKRPGFNGKWRAGIFWPHEQWIDVDVKVIGSEGIKLLKNDPDFNIRYVERKED